MTNLQLKNPEGPPVGHLNFFFIILEILCDS